MNGLIDMDRFLLAIQRCFPSKLSLSGSGPKFRRRGCTVWLLSCHKTQPNLRGSLNLRICPAEKQKSTWSCLPGSSSASTILKLPLMPRWIIIWPWSFSKRRYLPRRLILWNFNPSSIKGSFVGTTHLSLACLMLILFTWWLVTKGSMPRSVVSTSGSSGNFNLPISN